MRALLATAALLPLTLAAIAWPQAARAEAWAVIRTPSQAPVQATVVIGTPRREPERQVIVVPERRVVVVRPREEGPRYVGPGMPHEGWGPRRVVIVENERRHHGWRRYEAPERVVVVRGDERDHGEYRGR